jgi:hypothetical protein
MSNIQASTKTGRTNLTRHDITSPPPYRTDGGRETCTITPHKMALHNIGAVKGASGHLTR